MDNTQTPTPVKHPVEDALPDPLAVPELPEQTLSDEELDKALPVVREQERQEEPSPSEESTQ